MDERLRRGFRVGAFDVEPLSGRIRGAGGEQHVQPKVMDVLVFLAEHSGELVERDTLLEQVWRRITSEEVLTRCISELRRAFGDDRGRPRYIQTVPKRGYRLVELVVPEPVKAESVASIEGKGEPAAPAERTAEAVVLARANVEPFGGPEEGSAAAVSSRDPPPPASAMASVAVLPFENHSIDPTYAFMGDAFATELHGTLARVDRLRVVSRKSSFAFKDANVDVRDIGRKLDVGYVISGSVQCDGVRLYVVAELDDASSGTQIWAQSYARRNDDLLAIEKEIAGAIVASFTTQQLRAEIRNARQASTTNLDAWGLVQRARALALAYTPAGIEDAMEPLRRAIELDPNYAAAHAVLAALLVERLSNGWSPEPRRDGAAALEAAEKALTIAPQDPFILKMASTAWTYAGDYRKALRCLRKAVEYAPFDFGAWGYMGWPLTASGDAKDLRELQDLLDRLSAMEPQHPGVAFWRYHQSVAKVCEGDFEAARAFVEAALELAPSLSLSWMHYANVLGEMNARKGAQEALSRCKKVNPSMTPKHFEALMHRLTDNEGVVARRLGGLRKMGALTVPR